MPTRQDLMSLSSITKEKDLFRAKTAHVSQRQRSVSHNLNTNDIQGKLLIHFIFVDFILLFQNKLKNFDFEYFNRCLTKEMGSRNN